MAQEKTELYGGRSSCGGGVFFVDSKYFCRPDERSLLNSQD